jgi:hypothetical protein
MACTFLVPVSLIEFIFSGNDEHGRGASYIYTGELEEGHAHFLDDLAVPRANSKTSVPTVFLSGNDLGAAKDYLREHYAEYQEARYGLVASAKDRDLVDFGIPNDFQSTKRICASAPGTAMRKKPMGAIPAGTSKQW